MYSINLSEPATLRRRWGTRTDASAVMAAQRRLSSATPSNDDMDWSVHSLMLSFQDLHGLSLRRRPSCSMIFGSVSWRQTWSNNDSLQCWRLTAETPEVWLGYWPVIKRICSLYVVCMICQASFCSICFLFSKACLSRSAVYVLHWIIGSFQLFVGAKQFAFWILFVFVLFSIYSKRDMPAKLFPLWFHLPPSNLDMWWTWRLC